MTSLQICKVRDIMAPSNASPDSQEVVMQRLVFQEPREPERQPMKVVEPEPEQCRRKGCPEIGTSYITVRYKGKESVYLVCDEHKEEHDRERPIAEHNQHNARTRVMMKQQRDWYE